MVEATVPTESTQERAIRDAAARLIQNAADKYGIQVSEVPQAAKDDALRFATANAAAESAKRDDPYFNLYEQQRTENELLRAQLGAVKQNQTVTAASENYKHPVSAERCRDLMGRATWFQLTDAQKIAALGVEHVDTDQVRKLFGKGANGHLAVDFQKANPRRYAALREVAKALNIYGG